MLSSPKSVLRDPCLAHQIDVEIADFGDQVSAPSIPVV